MINPIPSMTPIQPISPGGIGGAGGGAIDLPGTDPAAATGGAGFGEVLKGMIIDNPTSAQAKADAMAGALAAGGDIDPHQVATAQALAGLEVQISTRTISSTISSIRTLMQMQI